MNLSVLIATYKRKEILERCLFYLLIKSFYKPDQVVVVVGYKDGSEDVVRRYQANFPFIKMIEVENKSLGDSQNKGLAHCSGNIVATLDDDAFVFPDWAQMVKIAHKEHPEAGCIGGRIINMFPNKVIARLESHSCMPYDKNNGFYIRTIAGVGCTYKRDVMKKVGIFDDSLPAGMDTDYNWRVLKAGYKVWFDPRIKMYHWNRTKLSDFLRQQIWYGRGYFLVRKANPDLYSAAPTKLNAIRDLFKLAWFMLCIPGEALWGGVTAKQMSDRIPFVILLVLKGICARYGWVKEWIRTKGISKV